MDPTLIHRKFVMKWEAHLNHMYHLSNTEGLDPEVAQAIKRDIHSLHKNLKVVSAQKVHNGELIVLV